MPLTPDIYSYRFSVDGQVINDPANRAVIEAFPISTSKVAVPGALWTDAGAPRGAVTRRTYASAAIGGDEEYLVYTPPSYDASRTERYPVVYLLHGLGGEVPADFRCTTAAPADRPILAAREAEDDAMPGRTHRSADNRVLSSWSRPGAAESRSA